MSISDHKTISMFLRYNITSVKDQVEALKLTARYHPPLIPKNEQFS